MWGGRTRLLYHIHLWALRIWCYSFISVWDGRTSINISDYSFMAEHTDLRHIMGVGIAITRGSAASLSFCYCLLLLTMSRNLLTKLKEFSVQQYIPLDSHIQVQVHAKYEYIHWTVWWDDELWSSHGNHNITLIIITIITTTIIAATLTVNVGVLVGLHVPHPLTIKLYSHG
jgi:hypothetical protein